MASIVLGMPTCLDVVDATLYLQLLRPNRLNYTLLHKFCQGQNANIYTDSRHAFGVAHDFGKLWKQCSFLTSSGNSIKNDSYVQELLDAILFLPAILVIIKIPGHSKNLTLEVKENHLADISIRNVALKRNQKTAKPLSWSRGIFLQMIIQRNQLKRPKQLASENKIFNNC